MTQPLFPVDGGIGVALVRGLFDAGLLSLFGAVLFRALILPQALRRVAADGSAALVAVLDRALRRLAGWCILVTFCAGCGWLVLQSAAMAGTADWWQGWSAVPIVLRSTRFGHLLLLQGLALAISAATLAWRYAWMNRRLPLLPVVPLVLLQVGHGHAWSMTDAPPPLLAAGIAHLLAGGIWLGGLLPLLLVTRIAPPRVAAMAAWSFSIWGKWSVALVAASAAVQAWVLVGSVRAAFATPYGWMAGVKLALFCVLLGFACLNRYRLAPALLRPDADGARTRLLLSLGLQSLAGLAVLLAAGILSDLPPGMHMGS